MKQFTIIFMALCALMSFVVFPIAGLTNEMWIPISVGVLFTGIVTLAVYIPDWYEKKNNKKEK